MFDIGFLEILLIFVLGLVVIGPERLPGTIKTCAIWFSRLKRSVQDARAEFEQQIGADEIRREIHNQQILDSMRDLGDARKSFENKVNSLKDDLLADEESQNAAGADKEILTEASLANSESDNSNTALETVSKTEDTELLQKAGAQAQAAEQAAEDEAHEPMIHDDSGQDASTIPGRKPANNDHTTTEDNDHDGKQ